MWNSKCFSVVFKFVFKHFLVHEQECWMLFWYTLFLLLFCRVTYMNF